MQKLFFLLFFSPLLAMDPKHFLGFTPLHKEYQPETIATLLERGHDVNQKAAWGLTPLHIKMIYYANVRAFLAHKMKLEISPKTIIQNIYWLLSYQADWLALDKDSKTPIAHAGSKEEQQNLLDLLMKCAIKHNNASLVQKLLSYGASLNGKKNFIPLHYALRHRFENCVHTLLKNGADPYKTNQDGVNAFAIAAHETVLMARLLPFCNLVQAMRAKNLSKVEHIIKNKMTLYKPFLEVPTTPAIKKFVWYAYAVQLMENRELRAMEELLKDGFDVNAKQNGEPLLHRAIKNDNYLIVELLLRHGANPCITDSQEKDALYFIKSNETKKLLIASFLKTPLAQAIQSGSAQEVQELLPETEITLDHLAIETTPKIKKLLVHEHKKRHYQRNT